MTQFEVVMRMISMKGGGNVPVNPLANFIPF